MARRLATAVDVPRLLAALGIEVEYEDRGELYARCPFPWHDDEKPSWSIRNAPGGDRHGRHHCFSCTGGGGPVGLVRDVLGLEEDEAAAWLETTGLLSPEAAPDAVSVEVVDPTAAQGGGRRFRLPVGVVQRPVAEWPERPRRYALEERRLEPWQVERWGIGYGAFGRCIGRLVIPVHGAGGELVSYQARCFDGRDKVPGRPAPKYLTPAREEGPGAWPIFGSHLWEGSRRVVVAEGALKALACERAGEANVAAILGSNLSGEHVLELQRFDQVVVVKDHGLAGDGVVAQLLAALGRWRELEVIEPPPGHDADSMEIGELASMLVGSR